MADQTEVYSSIASSLLDDIVDATEPSAERVVDILNTLQSESRKKAVTVQTLERTRIGKVLTKTLKACKRHRRTAESKDEWDQAVDKADELLASFKQAAESETKAAAKKKAKADSLAAGLTGLPNNSSAYRTRLTSQNKEMYKDPPAMPPAHITIEGNLAAKPKRNSSTGELTFKCGEDGGIAPLLKDFRPNRTPEEVLRAGSFGGTYFRPIASAVTNVRYSSASVLADTVKPEWISGLNKPTMLTSSTYRKGVNKFGVKCGGSLGMWESSGWIADSDPYSWFQWYCRFFAGRRCSDDARQISRWKKSAGLRGRFRSQICNKIIAAGTSAGDTRISPVIRQTLLHWGLEITEDVVEKHRNR